MASDNIQLQLVSKFENLLIDSMHNSRIKNINPDKIILQYCNLRLRLIKPVPRKIFFSKEFLCPDEHEEALQLLINKIEKGEDLTPYLSKKINDLDSKDYLLNDWGIHHLHLGILENDKKISPRTNDLLYVVVKNDNLYLLQVMNHKDFVEPNLLKILHNNWPELIEFYRYLGASSVPNNLSKDEIASSRKNGQIYFIEVAKNAVYCSPGGGYASSRDSLKVVRLSDAIHTTLLKMEDDIKSNFSYHKNLIQNISGYNGKQYIFEVALKECDTLLVLEKNSKVTIFECELG